LNENLGHLSFWLSGISETYKDRFYFLTDHDLDLSQIPDDFVDVLFKGLENPKKPLKSGFSLKIDDLPDNTYANQVRDWEYKFWNSNRDINNFYESDIDTTFALYDKEREYPDLPYGSDFYNSVRSPSPYTARHLPWYNTPENIDEEEIYYLRDATNASYWADKFNKNFTEQMKYII
jgi:hypothetical protein